MRTFFLPSLVLSVAFVACKPDVGPPASLIQGPTILAVRGQPAEAKDGEMVLYEALVVDVSGRIAVFGSDLEGPLLWSVCDQPKPPIENNSVTVGCLDTVALPGYPGVTPSTFAAPIPDQACALFGPTPPTPKPDEPPIRARDPDITGGYYVPVRASLVIPEGKRRSGMATADTLTAFSHQRIFCGIAGVPSEIAREYLANYKKNTNPNIAGLKLLRGDEWSEVFPVRSGNPAIQVRNGEKVSFFAGWSAESVETYPAWDVVAKKLAYLPESFRVSWFASGGEFEFSITGRSGNETESSTGNTWTANAVGLIHIWIVLHDSRGGTDFESYVVEVIP